MTDLSFVGPMIRYYRLKKNWSQETLCSGICAVSYLSKIEKGKVSANKSLIKDLTDKLGLVWTEDEDRSLRDNLYEAIFSWNDSAISNLQKELEQRLIGDSFGPFHLDLVVINGYISGQPETIPAEMLPMLTARQRCLYAILTNDHELAFRCYPCALSAYCVAEDAYCKGNYTYALEYLNIAYEKAAREGYTHLMMICQSYMANCYSDVGNMDAMQRHAFVALRIARSLGCSELVSTIEYNLAATELEHGNVQNAYVYFSSCKEHSIMCLHKLAICCEKLGKREEAIEALDKAVTIAEADPLDLEMCALVRYRMDHKNYLYDKQYGEQLIKLFYELKKLRHHGYVKFHLPWMLELLKANRKYKEAYELMCDFTNSIQ